MRNTLYIHMFGKGFPPTTIEREQMFTSHGHDPLWGVICLVAYLGPYVIPAVIVGVITWSFFWAFATGICMLVIVRTFFYLDAKYRWSIRAFNKESQKWKTPK